MAKKGILVRDVATEECEWLEADLKKGHVVYECRLPTYGAMGSGIAVSDKPDKYPCYEIPQDAVRWDS
jgi:hypothetical protein